MPSGRYGDKDRQTTIPLRAWPALPGECPMPGPSWTVPMRGWKNVKGSLRGLPPGTFAKADGMVAMRACGRRPFEERQRNACPANRKRPNRRQCVCSAGFYGDATAPVRVHECPWGAVLSRDYLRSCPEGFWRLTENI